jgi:hypothetical protein
MSTKHVVGIYFASAYILACIIISILHIGGDWSMIYMLFLAFPFSILSGIVVVYIRVVFDNYFISAAVFLIMNTIWWYFLGRLFYYMKNKKIDD